MSSKSLCTRALLALVATPPCFAAAPQLGASYCPAVRNSTGAAAVLVARGSLTVDVDHLELVCAGLPAGTTALFLFGRDAAFLPGHAGTAGTLCLATPFVRDPRGPVVADAQGVVTRRVPTGSVPLPGGSTAVSSGDSLRVQVWYRDAGASPAGANTSDGHRVSFGDGLPESAEILVATGASPEIELVDLDGDGTPDIVAVGEEGLVTTHLALGRREFEERARIDLATSVTGLAVGDLDGDGAVDVALALPVTGEVVVLTGDGQGDLVRAPVALALPGARVVRMVDIDGDGDNDLVVALGASFPDPSSVIVLENQGGLVFDVRDRIRGRAGFGTLALEAGDFDLDGDLDVLFVDYRPLGGGASGMQVLQNDGTGRFTQRPGPPSDAYVGSLQVFDVDGDGVVDVVLGRELGQVNSIDVHLGDGVGGFLGVSQAIYVAAIARAADLDGDGDLDLAGREIASHYLTLLENRAGWFVARPQRVYSVTDGMGRLVDFDRDGELEVVLPKRDAAAVGIREVGAGFVVDDDDLNYLPVHTPRGLEAADFDGDGDEDVLALYGVFLRLLENRSAELAIVTPELNFGGDVLVLLGFDADNDQRPDLVAVRTLFGSNPRIAVRRNLGGFNFAPPTTSPAPSQIHGAVHADLDLDGDEDLVLAGASALSVALGDGGGGFGTASVVSGSVRADDLALADIDGDLRVDIVTIEQGPRVSWRPGDGAGGFGAPSSTALPAAASRLVCHDIDGDGDCDVVVLDRGSGVLTALRNDPQGRLVALTPFSGVSSASEFAVRDADLDGHADLLVASRDARSVDVYGGRGDGTFVHRRGLALQAFAVDVLPLDLDGDGRPELVSLDGFFGGWVSVLD